MFRDRYIHRDLLRAWSDDGRNVSFYNPISRSDDGVRDIGSIYYFEHQRFPLDQAGDVLKLEDFFSITRSTLLCGDLSIMRDESEEGRRSLLFQLTRLPIFNKFDYVNYGSRPDSSELKNLKGMDYFRGPFADLSAGFLSRVTTLSVTDAIEIMDLEAKFLVLEGENSFIIGPSCFNVLNPYFEKKLIKPRYVDKAYDLRGAVLVLPLTPRKALMLYDSSVYDIDGDGNTISLSSSDVDILNMVQIYNSDIDGVVYKGEREYLDEITSRMGESPFRDGYGWTRCDRFPFSTLLSFMSIRKDAMKDISSKIKSPLRPFVKTIRNYAGFEAKTPLALQKRWEYAMSIIGR